MKTICRAVAITPMIAASSSTQVAARRGTSITPEEQPKLVMVLVVDALPNEQVQRYRDQFGQGGFRRLLEQEASYNNAHQAHGVTVTAVGHAAILSSAYPYQHGVIGNNWIGPLMRASAYCTAGGAYTYLGEKTKAGDGISLAAQSENFGKSRFLKFESMK